MAGLTKTATSCENEAMDIACSDGGKINVVFANFGRLDDHTCPHDFHDYESQTDCRAQSSLERVQAECQGKVACSVKPTTALFSDPCWGIFKYLLVKYQCKN